MSSVQFYHPSSRGNGFATSFSDSFNNDCVFATIIKQSGWDETTKTGSFKASREDVNANVTIKLNDLEVAAILDAIERGRPFSTYHDGDVPKNIQFVPWFPKVPEGTKVEQRGFSFSITIASKDENVKGNAFYIGFSFPEARLIREFLANCLNSHFDIARDLRKDNTSLKERKQEVI
jgi:hypothetical protein